MNAADEAKLLAECSAGPDGRIDPKRVAAACEVACRGGSAARKLAVLRKYERLVQRKARAASVTVESSAELSDAAGKKFQRSIADIRGVKPGELVLAPFSLTLDGLAKGNYTVDFKLNGKSVGTAQAVKADVRNQIQ